MVTRTFWPVMDLLGTIERFDGRDNLQYMADAAWGELRATDGIDYVLAVTAEKPSPQWMLDRRADLVRAGRPPAKVDVMTLAEFVDAIRHQSDPPADDFVPNTFQAEILRALNGKAMVKTALALEVCGGEASRLYKRNRKGDLNELRDLHLVENKPRLGYYRPDRPPRPDSD